MSVFVGIVTEVSAMLVARKTKKKSIFPELDFYLSGDLVLNVNRKNIHDINHIPVITRSFQAGTAVPSIMFFLK